MNKKNEQAQTATTESPIAVQNAFSLKGSCIVNVTELQKAVEMLTSHCAQCGGTCTLDGESMHSGLAVVF